MNSATDNKEKLPNYTLRLVFGVILLCLTLFLIKEFYPMFSNDLSQLKTFEIIIGKIEEVEDIPDDCDREGRCWGGVYVEYSFLFNDKKYSGSSDLSRGLESKLIKSDSIGADVEIEFIPQTPQINRVRGAGIQSYKQLFKRHIGGLIIIPILLTASLFLIISGGKYIWHFPQNPIKTVFTTILRFFLPLFYLALIVVLSIVLASFIRNIFGLSKEGTEGLSIIIGFVLFLFSFFLEKKFRL